MQVNKIYYSKLKSDDIKKIIKDLTKLQLEYSTRYNDNDNFTEQFDYIQKAKEKLEDVLFILELQFYLSTIHISRVTISYYPQRLTIISGNRFLYKRYKYSDNPDNLKEYLLYKAIKVIVNGKNKCYLDFRFLDGYKEDGLVKEPSIISATIASIESFNNPSSGNYIRGSVISIDGNMYMAVTPIHKGDLIMPVVGEDPFQSGNVLLITNCGDYIPKSLEDAISNMNRQMLNELPIGIRTELY